MGKRYPVGIVGESNYQTAIRRCAADQRVLILHEVGNPYDERALRVDTQVSETVGYIPANSWLHDVIHDQGKGAFATVKSINTGGNGLLGVVIEIELIDGPVPTRPYIPNRSEPPTPNSSQGTRFVQGLLRGLFK